MGEKKRNDLRKWREWLLTSEKDTREKTDQAVGEMAVERGLITRSQLEQCLAEPGSESLGEILLKKNLLSKEDLLELLQIQRNMSGRFIPKLDRYEIHDILGEGGVAVVYRAWDRELKRSVAIKLLRESASWSHNLQHRFQREAQIAAGISHPNVVAVHDVGETENRMYMIMELVGGRSLAEVLDQRLLETPRLLQLLEQAARGTDIAHKKGVIHRDLKPGNILVTPDGTAKVGDFGMAHLVDSRTALTRTGTTMGTPIYMAPEQVAGEKDRISPRTDVYALGATLYEIISGKPPFVGETSAEIYTKILNKEPEAPRRLDPSIHPDLEVICLKALSKEPQDRYAHAGEFGDDLNRFLNGRPISARPPSAARRILRAVTSRPAVSSAVIVFLLTAALAAVFLPRNTDNSEALARARPHLDAGRRLTERLNLVLMKKDSDSADEKQLIVDATREFEQALQLHPTYPEPLLELARLSALQLFRPDAIDYCTRAIEASPEFASAYLERAVLRLERYAMDIAGTTLIVKQETEEQRRNRLLAEEDLEQVRKWGKAEREIRFAEGMLLFSQRRFRESAELLTRFANESVTDARGWAWAALAWFNVEGETGKAAEQATRGLQYRPRSFKLLNIRGIAREHLGDLKGAVEDFTNALRTDPMQHPLWMNRADTHRRLGNRAEALRDINQAVALEPNDAAIWNNRGNLLIELHRTDEAMESFNRALDVDPKFYVAYAARGQLKVQTGDIDGGLDDLSRAIRAAPDDPEFLNTRAEVYMAHDRLDEAWADLDRALTADRNYKYTWFRRGRVESLRGKYDRAIDNFNEAIRIDPDYSTAYHQRGLANANLKNRKEAIADYSEALRINPGLAGSHCMRGMAHELEGNIEAALKDFDAAIRKKPDYAKAYKHRGGIRMRQHDGEAAVPDFEQLVKLTPDDADAWFQLGVSRYLSRDHKGAVADYSRSLKLRPDQPVVYVNRGASRLMLKDYAGALEDGEKALSLAPKDWKYKSRANMLVRAARKKLKD